MAMIERQRAEALAQQVAELTAMLKAKGELPDSVPESFRGTVTGVEGDVLSITPGADAGLRKGMTLEVYRTLDVNRGAAPQKVLGRLTIVSVEPKEAVGRFTSPKAKLPGDELPKKGDLLRSAKQ